jgi:hypothetical protein
MRLEPCDCSGEWLEALDVVGEVLNATADHWLARFWGYWRQEWRAVL